MFLLVRNRPVVFGQDEQSSSGAATSYSSAGASTASGLESSRTLDSSSSKSATIASEEAERTPAPKQRQKKIQTIKTRAVRSKYVYITVSGVSSQCVSYYITFGRVYIGAH